MLAVGHLVVCLVLQRAKQAARHVVSASSRQRLTASCVAMGPSGHTSRLKLSSLWAALANGVRQALQRRGGQGQHASLSSAAPFM